MKKMEEIRLLIDIAQRGWNELDGDMRRNGIGAKRFQDRREKLKNLLEEIRKNLEGYLFNWNDTLSKRMIVNHLDKILSISKHLRMAYAFAGDYRLSDDIYGTKKLFPV